MFVVPFLGKSWFISTLIGKKRRRVAFCSRYARGASPNWRVKARVKPAWEENTKSKATLVMVSPDSRSRAAAPDKRAARR